MEELKRTNHLTGIDIKPKEKGEGRKKVMDELNSTNYLSAADLKSE